MPDDALDMLSVWFIDQCDQPTAQAWLLRVEEAIACLPPIKQRAGRQPDLRTGMQDPSVPLRLRLQMARTCLEDRIRRLSARAPVVASSRSRVVVPVPIPPVGKWGLAGMRRPPHPSTLEPVP